MIGQTIHQYEILEQLGKGGMGVVYKARDTKLDRIVALKFLPTSVSMDATAKERFMQEARAASGLDDPYICTIHDIGETDDDRLYIVMAFYDGTTLKYRIQDRPIDLEEACSIARQMALGLSAAHEAGIVHRDVKPANVMVTEKGRVKLLDFGVAKLEDGADLTQAGSTIGTAAYMSPEQARGETVDRRSDIWSIGAVLYEMLSGSRPFTGPYEAAVAYSILNEAPAPLTDVSEEVKAIVGKALSKDPEARYASAAELANDLAAITGDSLVTGSYGTARHFAASGSDAPSRMRVVTNFTMGAAAVLMAVYILMYRFGLPDWVFPAAVFLALAGLPIVFYSASLDRKRARLDSGERRRLQGLKAWLTTRRAYQGGLFAGGTLVLAVVAFVIMRSAGVGPFATLISGGAIDRQDAIIVADFENRTDDESLGTTVTEAFKIDLSQSSAIRMLDRSQVVSALQRMQMNPDTLLTSALAHQVAEREGAAAIIEGDINAAGAGYILNARILSVPDGAQLAAFRENARSDADILDAIDGLSAELREGIGESLVDIRASEPLERVTTSNTEALRLYSRADDLANRGEEAEAIELLTRVIDLDSTFAMAYRKLAVLNSNTGQPQYVVDDIIKKGYELRDRLPVRERLLTEAFYYSEVEDDEEKEAQAYEEVLRKHPYDRTALNNLSIIYRTRGNPEGAEKLLRRALENEEGFTFRSNLIIAVGDQGDIQRMEQEIRRFEEVLPENPRVPEFKAYVAYLEDDFGSAYAWADSLKESSSSSRTQGFYYALTNNLYMAEGRLSEARHNRIERDRINRDRLDWQRLEAERWGSRTLDSLSDAFDMEWEAALLTGQTDDMQSAWSDLDAEISRRGGIPDSLHSERGLFALAFATTGDLEKAGYWHEDHLAFHARSGESLEMWGLMAAGYVRARLGEIDEGLADMEKGIEQMACGSCFRPWVGDIEESRGNFQEAVNQIESWVDEIYTFKVNHDEGAMALYSFRLGYLHEQLGNIDEAIKRYQFMADRWANADAVLQPQVAEARRRVEQLLDEKAREPGS